MIFEDENKRRVFHELDDHTPVYSTAEAARLLDGAELVCVCEDSECWQTVAGDTLMLPNSVNKGLE